MVETRANRPAPKIITHLDHPLDIYRYPERYRRASSWDGSMEEETAVELGDRYAQVMQTTDITDPNLLNEVRSAYKRLIRRESNGERPATVSGEHFAFTADGVRWITFASQDWFHIASSPVYNPREVENSDFSPKRMDPIFCYLSYQKGWKQLQRVIPRDKSPHWMFVRERDHIDDYKAAIAIEDHMNRMGQALKSPNATLIEVY